MGGGGPVVFRDRQYRGPHAIQGPLKIHRRGAGPAQLLHCVGKGGVGRVLVKGQTDAVRRRGTNQWRSPYLHMRDRKHHLVKVSQLPDFKPVGQQRLIDDMDAARVGICPDGFEWSPFYQHRILPRRLAAAEVFSEQAGHQAGGVIPVTA